MAAETAHALLWGTPLHTCAMSRELLTYDAALEIMRGAIHPTKRTERLALENAVGRIIATDLHAEGDNPRFDNSGVDGYAISCAEDGLEGAVLVLSDSVSAGSQSLTRIEKGTAVRIFTGAPTPPGTWGIVMQEDVSLNGGRIQISRMVSQGDFIRRAGADFQFGKLLMKSGTRIDPSNVPLLAFNGEVRPPVFVRPKVAVISTGDEIVSSADIPSGPQIRDTNGPMLAALTGSVLGNWPEIVLVRDNRQEVVDAIWRASELSDVVILSGGASVGDRDFVASVLQQIGHIHFHGVKIRPGKPVLFGQVGASFVFGLPGNPASSYVCFELFVREALLRLTGALEPPLRWWPMRLGFDHKAMGRDDFVRARMQDGILQSAGEQGSFGIISPAEAEFLIRFPVDQDLYSGDTCLAAALG